MRILALLPLLVAGWGQAATLTPTKAEVAAASQEGAALVNADKGYPRKNQVVYEVPDTREIKPTWGAVDAIVLATPLERARHEGYLTALSGQNFDTSTPNIGPATLSFVVYAHGTDRNETRFVERFGIASLVFGHRTLRSSETVHTEASAGTYPLAQTDRDRQVSIVEYRFDFSRNLDLAMARGRLRFKDSTGKRFDVPFNLARFP
jgi:hypothetical protein